MSPPAKKVARLSVVEKKDNAIKKAVQKALGNPKECATLLRAVTGIGRDGDIVKDILDSCNTMGSNLCLSGDMLSPLREHFAQMGVSTAATAVTDYTTLIRESIEKDVDLKITRNLIFLLCYLLGAANILAFKKLRMVIREQLTPLIQLLWNKDKIGEACYVSRQLLYVLLAERIYLEEAAVEISQFWLENIALKITRKNPLMAVLTKLLGVEESWIDKAITKNLSKLEHSLDTHEDMTLGRQIYNVVIRHGPALIARSDDDTTKCLVRFIISEAAFRHQVSHALTVLRSNRDCDYRTWSAVVQAVLELLHIDLEKGGTSCISASMATFADMITSEQNNESVDVKDKEIPKATARVVKGCVDYLDRQHNHPKISCGATTQAILSALGDLPMGELPLDASLILNGALVVLCYSFSDKLELIKPLVTAVTKLSRQEVVQDHKSTMISNCFLHLVKSWSAVNSDISTLSELRVDMSAVVARSGSCLDSEELSPYERLFRTMSECHYVLHRLAQKETIDPSDPTGQLIQESVNILWADVDFSKQSKTTDLVNDWFEVFSLATLGTATTDVEIKKAIPLIYKKKTLKSMTKAALAVVNGEYHISDAAQRTIVFGAARFLTKVVPLAASVDSSLIDKLTWKGLCRIRSLCRHGTCKELFEPRSIDEIVHFICSCPLSSTDEDDCDDMDTDVVVAVVAELLSTKLQSKIKDFEVSLMHVVEKSSESLNSIDLATKILQLVGGTVHELMWSGMCISVASVIDVAACSADTVIRLISLLSHAVKFCSRSIKGQNALFANILVKVVRQVQNMIRHNAVQGKEKDQMTFGLVRLLEHLQMNKIPFAKMAAGVLGEVVINYRYTELAMCRLHHINDEYGSAWLATNLPAAEKRAFSRVLPEMKKMHKKMV